MSHQPNPIKARRHIGRWVAAALAITLVALCAWYWTTTFPAKHLLHADPVTQIAALGKADPDHVERAARKSGDKRITAVHIGRDAWAKALNSIEFSDQGLRLNLTIETDDYTNSRTVGDVAPLLINDSAVAYVSRNGIIIDTESNTDKELHLNEQQTRQKADRALSNLLDLLADNW
jgi:hypothetical protein